MGKHLKALENTPNKSTPETRNQLKIMRDKRNNSGIVIDKSLKRLAEKMPNIKNKLPTTLLVYSDNSIGFVNNGEIYMLAGDNPPNATYNTYLVDTRALKKMLQTINHGASFSIEYLWASYHEKTQLTKAIVGKRRTKNHVIGCGLLVLNLVEQGVTTTARIKIVPEFVN